MYNFVYLCVFSTLNYMYLFYLKKEKSNSMEKYKMLLFKHFRMSYVNFGIQGLWNKLFIFIKTMVVSKLVKIST